MLNVVLFLVTIALVNCKCSMVVIMIWIRSLKVATNPLSGLEIVHHVVNVSVCNVATYFVVKAVIVVVAMIVFSGSLEV